MAKLGRFKSDEARAAYMSAYDEMAALSPIPYTGRDIETSFGTTHVHTFGAGPGTPLVLVHPLGGNGLCWYPVIEELSRDRVVYTLDTIGTAGRSVQTAPITERAQFGTWLDEVLAGLDTDRAHVLGYSDGGWHASMAAFHNAKRLASLTVIEPGGVVVKLRWSVLFQIMKFAIVPSTKNMARMNEWVMPGVPVSEVEMRAAKASLGYQRHLPWGSVFEDSDLQSITIPSLWIFGGESKICHPAESAGQRVRSNAPQAEVEVYAGLGHGLFFANADIVVPRILEFLRRHDGSARTGTSDTV